MSNESVLPAKMEVQKAFRPRARMLQLLGEQLIGTPRAAVFELVKNAYDADAGNVNVSLDLRPSHAPSLKVTDDGDGMTLDTIQKVWLVPGHDYREKQRQAGVRTKRHRRLPLGEKGLGRFAVHKLGNRITLVTRAENEAELVIDINWLTLIDIEFLDQAPLTIVSRPPTVFVGEKTGTQIEITELRSEWTRGEVRRLQRQLTSICSPFQEPGSFSAKLEVLGEEKWLDNILDTKQILENAIFRFSFTIDKSGLFEWDYGFTSPPGLKLEARTSNGKKQKLILPTMKSEDAEEEDKVVADRDLMVGIGPIKGEFYVFDRDRKVLNLLSNTKLLSNYLDDNGGVRVYRDGIRVYNYGEPGDDWLGLDLRRVNIPTKRVSRNILIGAIHLSLEHSFRLVEKTNREGFVEDSAYERLQRMVLGTIAQLEAERHPDKERLRALTGDGDIQTSVAKIDKPLDDLRRELDKHGIKQQLEPYLTRIETNYRDMQETLLSASMSGLNLAVVFHEVERGVRALHQVIVDGTDPAAAARQARDLMHLLDGFAVLLRRDSIGRHTAKKLIEAARQYNVLRFRHHRVTLVCPLLESGKGGFEAKFSFSMIIGALNNLIDNALYWMRVRWTERPKEGEPSPRKLYLGCDENFEGGPAIIVADTGPGFQDSPELLIRPFFSRRPNGMGLGLYYANMAMELSGGKLQLLNHDDVDLPDGFDGAVAALVFKEAK